VAALLVVRALPALLYAPFAVRRAQLVAAGLLQATSLSIPIVAGAIGVDLGLIRPTNYVALVAAGLLSVVLFPLLALPLLAVPAPDSPDCPPPGAAGPLVLSSVVAGLHRQPEDERERSADRDEARPGGDRECVRRRMAGEG
jgi:hypothetical protein